MPDGRSGGVRQWLRQVRSCSPRGGRGGHADRTPTMVTWLGRGRGLRSQWFRAGIRLSAAFVAMSAAATRTNHYVSVLVPADGRRPDTRPRCPIAADISVATRRARPHVPDTNRPDGGSSGSRGRTVSPLLALTRSYFLYPSSRPACGRPPAAAVLAPAATRRAPGYRPHPPAGGSRSTQCCST
jgi:hypothetical protein